ncbi:hypothetical protein DFH06DRAFT_1159616 [Mycena polygramma]|nr:hypothetical protein DFH06DRAFT_1159616 [Mycena polygramma]
MLENVPGAGTHGYLELAHQNHDTVSQFSALEFDPGQGSEREGAGVVRNSRRAMSVRAAPYASSSHSTGPIQAPQSSYPLFGTSFPSYHANLGYDIDLQSEYPLNNEETQGPSCSDWNTVIQSHGSTGPVPLSSGSSSSEDPSFQFYSDRSNIDDGMGSHQNYAHIGSDGTHEECLFPPEHSSFSSSNAWHGFTAPVQTSHLSYPSFETPIPPPHTNLDYPHSDPNHRPQMGYPSIYPNTEDTTSSQHNYAHIGSGGTHEQRPLSVSRPVQPHPQSFHGNIFSAHQIVNGQHINNHGESGINILHRAVALEALFDSADSSADGFPQPKCHPETRKEMVDNLYNWAVEDDPSQPIHWLHGPAGAGKSAIMRTLCELLQKSGHLGGAFFFKREHTTRGNAKVLFATLAYQIALNTSGLKTLISQSVEADPSVLGRQMDVQLNKLIVEPCQALPDSAPTILLIDGLDECDKHGAQSAILRSIRTAVLQHPTKFRFLVASRPEAHIGDVFEETSFGGILDSTDVEESFEDVRTYFRDEFSRIHREHRATMRDIPAPWPSPETVEVLVAKSSGYFIYASTVIKFIDDKYSRPTERLEAVQNLSYLDSDAPFAALDQLYIQILTGVPARFHSRLRDIFVLLPSGVTPCQVDMYLEMQPGETELILRSLHSVLYIAEDIDDNINAHHTSFLDFLEHPRRSCTFHPELKNRENVVRSILKVVSDDSKWGDTDTWNVSGARLLQYICALPPSEDLVPLIRQASTKPPWCPWMPVDYLWGDISKKIQSFISWLTAIKPVPEDLIQRWEAYELMSSLDAIRIRIGRDQFDFMYIVSLSSQERLGMLQSNMSGSSSVSLAACYQFVARCPTLISMLQALWLLNNEETRSDPAQPPFIQLLLDFSWDDLTMDLSALRSLIDGGTQKQLEFYPYSIPDLPVRLARAVFRLIQQVGDGRFPYLAW